MHPNKTKNRPDKNIEKEGGVAARRQESIDTAPHLLLTRRPHSDLNLTTDTQTEATDLGFPVVRLHDTYSHSFQHPFGHTINKQADKHVYVQHAVARDGDAGMTTEAGIKWRNVWE